MHFQTHHQNLKVVSKITPRREKLHKGHVHRRKYYSFENIRPSAGNDTVHAEGDYYQSTKMSQ